MAKVSKEEYHVLKSLGDKWKWIARDLYGDRVGSLFVYSGKPFKDYDTGGWVCGGWFYVRRFHSTDDDLFRFIRWEDEEPYNIQELIEEYEDESEEKEVKKNIEWLKEVIQRNKDFHSKNTYQNESYSLGTTRTYRYILELINQLDEPEVLSPDWVDKHKYRYDNVELVGVKDLQNLLVPKQELPVIPKFVAGYLNVAKRDITLMRALEIANRRSELPKWEKEYDWISANDEAFARAWLNGYEVEEQKYYVINNDNGIMLIRMMDGKTITEAMTFFRFEDMSEVEKKSHRLTEQEIKDYDSRYWAFAVAVEELED